MEKCEIVLVNPDWHPCPSPITGGFDACIDVWRHVNASSMLEIYIYIFLYLILYIVYIYM